MFKPTMKKGDVVVCRNAQGVELHLKQGKEYPVVKDEEEGIFPGDPYVHVKSDMSDSYCCHSSRFVFPTDKD